MKRSDEEPVVSGGRAAPDPAPAAAALRRTLEAFAAAWHEADIDTLMSLMSERPTYRASSGRTYTGRDAVREAFVAICRPASRPPPPGRQVYFEGGCLSYWQLELPGANGSAMVDGVDVITFDTRGKIVLKDAYRKLA